MVLCRAHADCAGLNPCADVLDLDSAGPHRASFSSGHRGGSRCVTKWARMFYTRDPAAETYTDLVNKTGEFITGEVGDSWRRLGTPPMTR